MPIFAVLTSESRPKVGEALKRHYPNHVALSDTVRFVRASESARAISDKLFTATDTKSGAVVVRVSADYYGYSRSEIWDWLAAAIKEESGG